MTPTPRKKPHSSQSARGGEVTETATTAAASVPSSPSTTSNYQALLGGEISDPHTILGTHTLPNGTNVIRTLRPEAQAVTLIADGKRLAMTGVIGGIFETEIDSPPADYQFEVDYGSANIRVIDDPYRYIPILGELDLHLITEGRHEQLWHVLGAHEHSVMANGRAVPGVVFAVWAPHARGVRVAGDFDYWNGQAHPMRQLGSSGVWELFIPGLRRGEKYKFQLLGHDGLWRVKADPLAQQSETPPATASVVAGASTYSWADDEWMAVRGNTSWATSPMSIYEVHAGSWRSVTSYRELADQLVEYLAETQFTHVEFLPLAGHPFGGSWGYQVTSYYAVDGRLGSPDDFRYLVDTLHQAGYGVILDWVPAHFPRDSWALAYFDGTPLYEHPDPQRGEQPDWGTLVFDFGYPPVRNFLVANALFWLREFHLDGLRVDAVAAMLYLDYSRQPGQWSPNKYGGNENLEAISFLQELTATVGKHLPDAVLIAEESTSWPGVTTPTAQGGLGFGLKWNMGWMHDTLSYVGRDPIYRSWHHNDMTFSMAYAYSEQFVLPLSHDEVVHGKGSLWGRIPGDEWQKAATLRAYFAYQWAHPGKKLLFMGGEFGNPTEWNEADILPWHLLQQPLHHGIKQLVGDLNQHYRRYGALAELDFSPAGFEWISVDDRARNVVAFSRQDARGQVLVCAVNFAAVPHEDYELSVPVAGVWREIINTDATTYGGSGVGNMGAIATSGSPGQTLLSLVVPPLGALWLVPDAQHLDP